MGLHEAMGLLGLAGGAAWANGSDGAAGADEARAEARREGVQLGPIREFWAN